MAEKGFGVKKISFVQPSGSPTLTSPNNINLNAVNVAISTDVSIGATCTAYEFSGAIAGWEIGNDGSDHYSFKGPGFDGGTRFDPDIHLVRGQRYIFHNRSSGHPFRIQSTINGSAGTQYNTGVTNNDGAAPTDIVFDVPQDAPNILFYQCTAHPAMGGRFIIAESYSLVDQPTSSPRTLTASDAGTIVLMPSTFSTCAIDLPVDIFSPGDEVVIVNESTAGCTISGIGGVNFVKFQSGNNNGIVASNLNMFPNSMCKLVCVAPNRYYADASWGVY